VAEEFRDSVTIILAGYKDDIKQKLVAFNAGMSSRFKTVNFADFSQDQIAAIWSKNCKDNAFKCERDVTNVAARRIARGIGRKGFGNARSVRQLFERAASEAKMRFRPGKEPPQILVEDVIGKPPDRAKNAELDKWLRKLEQLTGLSKVKQAVNQLLETAKANYDKELRGEEIDLLMLNRLFLGNPGTGKTTVAEIYGKILTTLKFLSNGELMMKVGSDFVGDKVGEAQTKTRAILEAAEGKVLLIDEAYVLDDDLYGKQALDTIVEKVQATPGADICVIMAGYDAPMMKMLREQNPGLSSRFDPRYALEFSDYSDEELLKILTDEVNKGRIEMPIEVKIHAVEQLAKRRSMANFGNARAVKTLVMNAKSRLTERVKRGTGRNDEFEKSDVDPDLEDQDPHRALEELRKFGGLAADQLAKLGEMVRLRKDEKRSLSGLVNHFVFAGPPGTGKTSVARLLGRVLFSFGVIATKNVVISSSANLIGAYVGHSRKAVDEKMSEARGGVLLIDEAYDLGKGGFGQEALTQLLNNLTLPEYMDGKTIVVLAGYKVELHAMLEQNPGLKSRFTNYIDFEDFSVSKCVQIVRDNLAAQKPVAFEVKQDAVKLLENGFAELKERPGWANGRDAEEMCNKLLRARDVRVAIRGGGRGSICEEDVELAVKEFLNSRPHAKPEKTPDVFIPEPVATAMNEMMNRAVNRNTATDKRGVVEDVTEQEEEEHQQQKEEIRAEMDRMRAELEEKLKQEQDEAHKKALEEELRRLEELRLQMERAKAEELRKLLERERKRMEVKRKLASVGFCPAGYVWHREGSGFRCGGGSHFVSFNQLGITESDAKELGL
jgi:replication-associated recombination protein RarA